jgi:hypothetical protein
LFTITIGLGMDGITIATPIGMVQHHIGVGILGMDQITDWVGIPGTAQIGATTAMDGIIIIMEIIIQTILIPTIMESEDEVHTGIMEEP